MSVAWGCCILHSLTELLFSRSVVSDSLRPPGLQHTRFPVLHHLPEFAQTHVRWVSDAIQPSCPLTSPSPPALNLPQHHGLFQWVDSLHQVAKILELQLQHQSFQWIFRVDFLQDWLAWAPCGPKRIALLIGLFFCHTSHSSRPAVGITRFLLSTAALLRFAKVCCCSVS